MAIIGQYVPGSPPSIKDENLKAVAMWALDELERLGRTLTDFPILQLAVLHVAPDKPREGMVACADGTNWNPGSGAGFYGYHGGAWHLLG